MRVKGQTRFGKEFTFEKKEKVWTGVKRGETFMTALVRCYYPAEYRRMMKRYGKAA